MEKTIKYIIIVWVSFNLGCLFTLLWVVKTPNGNLWAIEESNKHDYWSWFPNLK